MRLLELVEVVENKKSMLSNIYFENVSVHDLSQFTSHDLLESFKRSYCSRHIQKSMVIRPHPN